ncbi:MAG: acyl-CoA dehydrogenase family protein [Bacillota bacterium]
MDFRVPEEYQEIQTAIRDWVNKRVIPVEQEIEEHDEVPARLLDEAKRMGLFGIRIPEEYGGLGLGVLGQSLIYEELGRTSHGLCTVIGAHTGIGTTGLVEMGSAEQKGRYLPGMATGERLACFALTEPQAGSDASQLLTTAERRGDRYILNGRKCFISNAPTADLFTVFAVTDKAKGPKGISAFLVERSFKGLEVGKPERKMGLRGSHTAELFFTDCEVPAENLLGVEGQGYSAALKILTKGRATLAARCIGGMERCLEESVAWAKQRVTMGKPIAEHQMIQAYLAEMATDIFASRAMTRQVAWMADQGMNVQKEAAMAKLFVTEAFARVADKAVQIHGGMGYMKEVAVERLYRDARITRIYEGTNEIQKLIIAGKVLAED